MYNYFKYNYQVELTGAVLLGQRSTHSWYTFFSFLFFPLQFFCFCFCFFCLFRKKIKTWQKKNQVGRSIGDQSLLQWGRYASQWGRYAETEKCN